MSERRAARRPHAVTAGSTSTLPADLAMGPCVEVWADSADSVAGPQMSARRRWREALQQWAVAAGHQGELTNLGRTRHVWSRDFLLSRGEHELVDYLEGRRATAPTPELPYFKRAGQ